MCQIDSTDYFSDKIVYHAKMVDLGQIAPDQGLHCLSSHGVFCDANRKKNMIKY